MSPQVGDDSSRRREVSGQQALRCPVVVRPGIFLALAQPTCPIADVNPTEINVTMAEGKHMTIFDFGF